MLNSGNRFLSKNLKKPSLKTFDTFEILNSSNTYILSVLQTDILPLLDNHVVNDVKVKIIEFASELLK